jgi:HAD superfamily hydrolase (TIGR01509 family)
VGLSAGVRWRGDDLALVGPTGRERAPIEALVFDLGGTLDHDGGSWGQRFRALLETVGAPAERVEAALEAGEQTLLAHPRAAELGLLEMVGVHLEAQLAAVGLTDAALSARLQHDFVAETASALRGRRGLLERLARRLPLAVVSNGCGNARRLLAEEGLDGLFVAIVDSSEVGFWKPDPRILGPALAKLGVAAERTAVVGDRLDRDVAAARAAGAAAVWVTDPSHLDPDDARLLEVDAVVASVEAFDPEPAR